MTSVKKKEQQQIRRVVLSDGRHAMVIRSRDPQGRIVEHAEIIDRYSKLNEQGRISEDEATSARRFHRTFVIANLFGITSTLAERTGGIGGGITDSQNEARVEISNIRKALGGENAVLASVLWHVVGAEDSVSDWIAVQAQNGRTINPNNATGVLCAALQLLDDYYRKRDRRS